MHNAHGVAHPVLLQRLAAALMHWPLVSASASLGLAIAVAAALGWAAVDSLSKLVG